MTNCSYSGLVLALLLGMCLLAACETSFEADLPRHEPILVVNGLWAADSLWAIHVSKTAPPGENVTAEPVDDARVEILRDGQVIETLEPHYFNEGTRYEEFSDIYRSRDERPEAGMAYTLHVSAPGFAPVKAVGRAPATVPLEVTGTDTIWAEDYVALVDISFRVSDPSNVTNYYLLSVSETVTYDDTSRAPQIQSRSFQSSDPVLLGEDFDRILSGESEPHYGEAVFGDKTIDGRTHEFRIRVPLHLDREGRSETKAFLELASISEDYYRYRVSRRPLAEDFDLENPFAEPLQLYSNVDGGVGIFAGSSIARVPVELE